MYKVLSREKTKNAEEVESGKVCKELYKELLKEALADKEQDSTFD